ncbi:MAG TPA: hypothetical protein VLD38_07205, partial [Nitrosopumilaceae archaeon]|nr:hypothetical protein [Nitrosopumilaceae archaeon]
MNFKKRSLVQNVSTLLLLGIVISFTMTALFHPISVAGAPVTQMSDTTQSKGLLIYSGRQITAEYVTTTSQLVGDNIDSITLRLQKVGAPIGNAQIGVFNPDGSVKQLFGTQDVATLPGAYQDFEFKLSNFSFYTIQSGDRIGIQYTGGSSTAGVNVMTDTKNADPFDGNRSYRTQFGPAWVDSVREDMYMILVWTPQDASSPTVSSVSSTNADGTYTTGNTVAVTVTF